MTAEGQAEGQSDGLRRLRLGLLAAGALGLAALAALACLRLLSAAALPELPVLGDVPRFELIDQEGSAFGSADLDGQVWVASFIYTTCPGPCPLVIRRMRALQERLAEAGTFRLVSITVDPQHDGPQVLGRYGARHGIDPRHWKLLTGSVEDVVWLIRHGFLLALGTPAEMLGNEAGQEAIEELTRGQGPVVHSTRLVLVDGERRVRGYYDSDVAADMEGLGRDLGRLVPALTP